MTSSSSGGASRKILIYGFPTTGKSILFKRIGSVFSLDIDELLDFENLPVVQDSEEWDIATAKAWDEFVKAYKEADEGVFVTNLYWELTDSDLTADYHYIRPYTDVRSIMNTRGVDWSAISPVSLSDAVDAVLKHMQDSGINFRMLESFEGISSDKQLLNEIAAIANPPKVTLSPPPVIIKHDRWAVKVSPASNPEEHSAHGFEFYSKMPPDDYFEKNYQCCPDTREVSGDTVVIVRKGFDTYIVAYYNADYDMSMCEILSISDKLDEKLLSRGAVYVEVD